MNKVQNSANKDSALDELCKRYEKRGMNYSTSPEYTEQESRENHTRTVAPSSYKISGGAGKSLREYKSGVAGKRRYMTDRDFADYYRNSREYTPDSNVELDTVVLLHRIDRDRYEKKKYTVNKPSEKKDVKAELKREADRANPKVERPLKASSGVDGGKPPQRKNQTPSKIRENIKVAAKTWIPLEEMKDERIVEGKKTKMPTNVILAIVVITISLMLIVSSAVLISTAKQEQNEVEAAIEDLDGRIKELQAELDRKNEGADIEIFAKEELGMIEQEHADLEYIKNDKTDEVNRIDENSFSFASLIEWLFPFLK